MTIRICTKEKGGKGERIYTVVDSVGNTGVVSEKSLIKDYAEAFPRSIPNLKVVKKNGRSGLNPEDYEVEYTPLEIKGFGATREDECMLAEGHVKSILQDPNIRLYTNADIEEVSQKVKILGISIKTFNDYILVGDKKDTRIYTNKKVFSIKHMVDVLSYMDIGRIDFNRKELSFKGVLSFSGIFENSTLPNGAVNGLECDSAISINSMFSGVKTDTLDISKLNFSNARFVDRMFSGIKCQTLIASNSTLKNAVSGVSMFAYAQTNRLDISRLDTRSMISMADMFRECHSKNGIDISNLNTSSCEDMSGMFQSCESVIAGIENIDTSNVINMARMFCEFNTEYLNISNFKTDRVANMTEMFKECNIGILDMRGISLKGLRLATNMFKNARIGKVILNSSKERLAGLINWGNTEIEYAN